MGSVSLDNPIAKTDRLKRSAWIKPAKTVATGRDAGGTGAPELRREPQTKHPHLCTASHANGYQCERPAGHKAKAHRGGDYTWTGTTRWRETQNRVLVVLMDTPTPMRTREVAKATGLHIRTVQRHVQKLKAEGLAEASGRGWAA